MTAKLTKTRVNSYEMRLNLMILRLRIFTQAVLTLLLSILMLMMRKYGLSLKRDIQDFRFIVRILTIL